MSLKESEDNKLITFFRESALTMKIFGLWKSSDLDMHKKNVIGIFIVMITSFILSISSFSGYFDLKAKGNLADSQMALIFSFAIFLCTFKLYSIWNSVGHIKICLKWLQECARKFDNQVFIKYTLVVYRYCFYIGMTIIMLTVISFLCIPAAENIRVFPLAIKNPVQIVDLLQSPFYELVFFYQAVSILLLGIFIMAYDTMFCGIMMLIAAFVKSINAFFIKTFREQPDNNMNDEKREKAMIKIMEDFIETTRIIDFVKHIFGLVSLSNLMFNISIIGFALYMASLLPVNSIMFWYLLTGIVMQLFQLGIYCFFGEAVVTQTRNLRYHIYQCDWYKQSKSFQIMILLTLHRTQNEPYFNAGKLFQLCNNTFSEILKTAFSFCMFLFNFKKSVKRGLEQ